MFKFWRLRTNENQSSKDYLNGLLTSRKIEEVLGQSNDVIIKNVYFEDKKIIVKAIGIDGLVNSEMVDEYILKPLTIEKDFREAISEKEVYNIIKNGTLYHFSQKEVATLKDAIKSILEGNTLVVFDNIKKAISFDVKKIPQRSIQEPESESVLKGARDAFVENLRTNTALIRKKVKSVSLRFENFVLGEETNTPINVVYLEDVADKDVLNKLKVKLSNTDITNLISSDNFESNIKDNKYSVFPQIQYTERVDKFCSNIVDGKIGILIDGLPLGYIVPGVLAMFLQAPEDYADNYIISSFVRIIRYFCFAIALVLPAFYVAITTFHHEMIPTNLLISIIKSKEGVPFSTFIEVIGLLIAFEMLLEASLRLPKTIGATISIIGGLIVGEAAVNAKFLSPAVVVIVAATGIAGFVIPNRSLANSVRVCRILIVLAAGLAGLFGISFSLMIILAYLCKLESFGVPYLTPYVGTESKGIMHDSIFRSPRDIK